MIIVRLTLWGNFAIEDGEQLFEAINRNTILLACGIVVKDYQGIVIQIIIN